MRNDTIIKVEHVSKLYGMHKAEAASLMKNGEGKEEVRKETGVSVALWDINLEIPQGKIFVIIGLSGSGKSTLVRCFNRLNHPSSGSILFKGTDIATYTKKELLDFRRNKISMVFQSFGLIENRDVLGNITYGLEVKGMGKTEREQRGTEILKMVGLEGWEHQDCKELSGGMRQRVGIARALANDSEVLLMDEPFSALDPLVRQDMQFELLQIQRKLNKTVIFITHDMDEAFKLGDKVAILKDGRLIQVATPEEMSLHPADDYVRSFIDNADKTKVMTVKNIMITPSVLVRSTDSAAHAIHVMNRHALSSAYVVDEELRLMGILDIRAAIKGKADNLPIDSILNRDVKQVRENDLISDIMPMAAESPYPLAVIDEDGSLEGIVTKASVLGSLT